MQALLVRQWQTPSSAQQPSNHFPQISRNYWDTAQYSFACANVHHKGSVGSSQGHVLQEKKIYFHWMYSFVFVAMTFFAEMTFLASSSPCGVYFILRHGLAEEMGHIIICLDGPPGRGGNQKRGQGYMEWEKWTAENVSYVPLCVCIGLYLCLSVFVSLFNW